jgi:serine/threonine-protein kinase RsbW
MPTRKQTIQLRLPSTFGYEKVAMVSAAEAARLLGLPGDRIDDLKTAVAEVCMNAIEHGNCFKPRLQVQVDITLAADSLQVQVADRGAKFSQPANAPCLEEQLAGDESARGWGLYLSQRLADELKFEDRPGSGTVTTLVFRRASQPTTRRR